MIPLPAVGDVDDLLCPPLRGPVGKGGEVGGGVIARSVRLSDDEGLLGEPLVFGMKDHQGPGVFPADSPFLQTGIDRIDLVAVKTLPMGMIEAHSEQIVNPFEGLHAQVSDLLPEGKVFRITLLQLDQFLPGFGQGRFVLLGQRISRAVEVFQSGDGFVPKFIEIHLLPLDRKKKHAELSAPVAQMVVPDDFMTPVLQQTGQTFTDDGRTDMSDVHLLGGVGRGVVQDDFPALLRPSRPTDGIIASVGLHPTEKKTWERLKLTKPGPARDTSQSSLGGRVWISCSAKALGFCPLRLAKGRTPLA